jgi:hypothetical protein
MKRVRLFFVILFLSAGLHAQVASERPHFSIAAPTALRMAELCKDTEDLRECGKKIETVQIQSAGRLVVRKQKLLTLNLKDGTRTHFLDSGGGEGGEGFAFFSYHAAADAITLYHNKADRLGFFVIARDGGAGSATPAEPLFSASGQTFLTVDVCKRECENRIAVWRISAEGVRRQAEFAVPSTVNDAAAAWTPAGTVWIEFSRDTGKTNFEMPLSDPRWVVVDPQPSPLR